MIKVTVYRNHAGQYTGLHCAGHAGFAEAGEDIVCAGVSVLVINTVNALEAFTDETFDARSDQKTGLIDIRLHHPSGHDGTLLLDAMVLGLQEIQDRYGTDYSFLSMKEV